MGYSTQNNNTSPLIVLCALWGKECFNTFLLVKKAPQKAHNYNKDKGSSRRDLSLQRGCFEFGNLKQSYINRARKALRSNFVVLSW